MCVFCTMYMVKVAYLFPQPSTGGLLISSLRTMSTLRLLLRWFETTKVKGLSRQLNQTNSWHLENNRLVCKIGC